MKKQWEALELEVLEVSETAAGIGLTKIDYFTTDGFPDADLYDS